MPIAENEIALEDIEGHEKVIAVLEWTGEFSPAQLKKLLKITSEAGLTWTKDILHKDVNALFDWASCCHFLGLSLRSDKFVSAHEKLYDSPDLRGYTFQSAYDKLCAPQLEDIPGV